MRPWLQSSFALEGCRFEKGPYCHFLLLRDLYTLESLLFLYRNCIYNYCIDYIRKRKRLYFESYEEDVINNTVAYDDDGVKNKMLEEERFTQLQGLISYLKDKDQVVIRMRYYEGLSIKQISDATGSGVSATKMRLKRAKTRLMEKANELAICS